LLQFSNKIRVMSAVAPLLLKQRILAAIRGAFVADAASMGTHWIYDPAVMAKTVDSVDAPEFKAEPKPNYYSSQEFPGHYEKGMLSPYGEQLLFVTEYIAQKKAVDGNDMSKGMLEWAETFGGRPDHATTTFVTNMKKEDGSGHWPNCGADDDQGKALDVYLTNRISAECIYNTTLANFYSPYLHEDCSSHMLVCWKA
jgi:ADP-ribosylglycohydrolase